MKESFSFPDSQLKSPARRGFLKLAPGIFTIPFLPACSTTPLSSSSTPARSNTNLYKIGEAKIYKESGHFIDEIFQFFADTESSKSGWEGWGESIVNKIDVLLSREFNNTPGMLIENYKQGMISLLKNDPRVAERLQKDPLFQNRFYQFVQGMNGAFPHFNLYGQIRNFDLFPENPFIELEKKIYVYRETGIKQFTTEFPAPYTNNGYNIHPRYIPIFYFITTTQDRLPQKSDITGEGGSAIFDFTTYEMLKKISERMSNYAEKVRGSTLRSAVRIIPFLDERPVEITENYQMNLKQNSEELLKTIDTMSNAPLTDVRYKWLQNDARKTQQEINYTFLKQIHEEVKSLTQLLSKLSTFKEGDEEIMQAMFQLTQNILLQIQGVPPSVLAKSQKNALEISIKILVMEALIYNKQLRDGFISAFTKGVFGSFTVIHIK